MPELQVSIQDIERARGSLRKILEPTPLLYNRWLSEKYGCKLYLKLENMQPIGSFKIRGATYKIGKLTAQQRKKGVIAASAGNHAQGVAWGSLQYKTKATIVMPETAPLTKVIQTQALKAKVILHGANYDEAYVLAKKMASQTGLNFVHPYEDPLIIAGQGTVGLEILEQLPDVDVIVGAMGGGGLMAGVGLAVKAIKPDTKIFGAQAHGSRSLSESIRKGRVVLTGRPETFADGIKVETPSKAMVDLLKSVVDDVATVDDEQIAQAVLTLLEKGKVVAEGSGAVSLAVIDQLRPRLRGKNVVLIISGGNIDVNILSRIIDHGMTVAGRRLRVNVWVKDKPGSLFRLTQLLANNNVNVLQVIHDRDSPSTGLDETEVELTLETRGQTHSREIIKRLRDHVVRVELLHK